MRPLGLECLSGLGLPPAAFVRLAGELGFAHVSLSLSGAANRLACYPETSLRDGPLVRDAVRAALDYSGVRLSLLEGFAITPELPADAWTPALDLAADLGARAVCVIGMDRDRPRCHDAFARFAQLCAKRGLIATTEVGAGICRDLERALVAAHHTGPSGLRLLIDTMHFFRSGSTVADIAALDPALIAHVQLCDVPMPAVLENYMDEALWERRAPGDGDLPLADFLAQVPADVPIGLEVPIRSQAEAGLQPHERFARLRDATLRLWERAA